METGQNQQSIGNVNVLDLRQATDASVASFGRIGNVNLVIQTTQTASYLRKLAVGNVNVVVTVPDHADVHQAMGLVELTAGSLDKVSSPIYWVVMGKLLIHPDVTPEAISNGIAGIALFGKLVCPETLVGVIQGKLDKITGKTSVYPVLDRVELRSLRLDEGYLNSLPDGTRLAVAGSLDVPEVLSNELIARKISVLYISASGLCHEENRATLQRAITVGGASFEAIPAGYRFVERPLVLDRIRLSALRDPWLYSTERIVLAEDVTADLVDDKIKGLRSEAMIVCPKELEPVIVDKIDLLENQVIFYDGPLWVIDGTETLRKGRLAGCERPTTLLVCSVLHLDEDLPAAEIRSGIARIHNFGVIEGSAEQIAALESVLGVKEGELHETGDCDMRTDWIGNVNLLEL